MKLDLFEARPEDAQPWDDEEARLNLTLFSKIWMKRGFGHEPIESVSAPSPRLELTMYSPMFKGDRKDFSFQVFMEAVERLGPTKTKSTPTDGMFYSFSYYFVDKTGSRPNIPQIKLFYGTGPQADPSIVIRSLQRGAELYDKEVVAKYEKVK
jgi:hypothetical protein